MRQADVVIIGGGPAGSSCAWKLVAAGLDVVVLDKAEFPRTKLCAGWVTPEAIADLEFDVASYPYRFLTFERLHLHWKFLSAKVASRQHSIRRFEFDDYLLRRSGAEIVTHKVREVRRSNGDFLVDGAYRCRYIVGAGGTACPVYRSIFREHNPRARTLQAATLEQEFAYEWQDPDCHLWFFEEGLPGYAWYVPKQKGYVNVGLGGMAEQLKAKGAHLQAYWDHFIAKLHDEGFVEYDGWDPKGYSYYLRGDVDVVRDGNAYIVGDAVGLATRDLCEGIGPAVKSGLLAARSIVDGDDYSLSGLLPYSGHGLFSRLLERRFAGTRLAA